MQKNLYTVSFFKMYVAYLERLTIKIETPSIHSYYKRMTGGIPPSGKKQANTVNPMINIENNVIIIPPGNVRKRVFGLLFIEKIIEYTPRRRLIIAIVT